MNYPLISEYVEAVRSAEDNFDKLSDLRPVLDDGGNPVMSSGNFAVVFKMQDMNTDRIYALKCFTKEQEGREDAYRQIADEFEYVQSTYLAKVVYYDRELFVDTQSSDESEFPVLLMDWVEGMTLDRYIRQNIDDKYALEMLAYNFSRLAMWLLPQPFAHGDLKPDNILVQEDGSLTLVDYDGMYVPAMQGQKSRELGSPDFRHPLRTQEDFNEHIDDFPAISILLSLSLIASDPSLLDRYGASDRLLFAESDYRDISSCQLLKTVFPSQQTDINTLVSLFTIACAHKTLSQVSFRLMAVEKPKKPAAQPILVDEELLTEVTEEDLENAIVDEFGVKYSRDGKRLLSGRDVNVECYKIKEGSLVICDDAFYWCESLREIVLPSSVTSIGNYTFCGCESLQEIEIPQSVKKLGINPFVGTHCKIVCKSPYFEVVDNVLYDSRMSLMISFLSDAISLLLPPSVTSIGDSAFSCRSLQKIVLPSSVTGIGDSAFISCRSLQEIVLSSNVTSIGNSAFRECESLHEIVLPSSVTSIGDRAFYGCESLHEIVLPSSITSIGDTVFFRCKSLRKVLLSSSVTSIGDAVFCGCESLQEIVLPSSVTNIGKGAFSSCWSLQEIVLPSSVISIGDSAFYWCSSLQEIVLPLSVISIGDSAFYGCSSLREIVLPSSVTSIGNYTFCGCESLQEIEIPQSVKKLGINPFAGIHCKVICKSPYFEVVDNILYDSRMSLVISFLSDATSLSIPSSVTSIGDSAFYGCSSLREIVLPSSVTSIGDSAFYGCESLQEIVLPSSVTSIGDSAFWGTFCLRGIKIPKGCRSRFEKLFPSIKDKLIEIDNI